MFLAAVYSLLFIFCRKAGRDGGRLYYLPKGKCKLLYWTSEKVSSCVSVMDCAKRAGKVG
jgi:hypothetical protein